METGFVPTTLMDEQLEQEKDYWSKKLSGELAPASLPLDYRRPGEFKGERASIPVELGRDAEGRLLEVCGGRESLVFAILVAALKICLFRYSGVEDVTVGTAIHERYGEVASLNKVLALRTEVRGGATLRQLLEDVRRTLSEAYAHQKFPFDRILELLNVEWPNNRAPLFSVVALLENINRRENILHLKNDLTLAFSIKDGGITGAAEYNPHLFDPQNIEIFARHYRATLRAILESPDTKVEEIELLTPERKRKLVFDYNATERDYPRDKTVQQLFEEQAARTPEAVAVVRGEDELTYAALSRRSNQLARHLLSRGVGRGARVGIYLGHSPETLVALLGVLKAGAAYVPFEPAHPRSQLEFMLEDAGITFILTERRSLEGLSGIGVETLCLDAEWGVVSGESDASPAAAATPGDLAYVIYTSGSTGQPKGVKIQHGALLNYVSWAAEVYGFGEGLAVPLYSSLSFDLTVTSIYPPLISGDRIIVYRQEGRESPLADILAENRVELVKLTPSHLSLIKDQDNRGSRVRRLIVGGEALETELARRVLQSFGGLVEIYNEYGPTEATVGCMLHRFDPERDRRALVPVGRPAANARLYVLDTKLRPVAENVLGEMYIGGECLAAGYLNRGELTAERFVSDPQRAGERMYRSGDMARWLPEGVMEYVGRRDGQVKYHGYRVELGELKAALNRHPQVRDSAVVMAEERGGGGLLVAYYVSRQEVEGRELREWMAAQVIEEMLPNMFVHLKKLPLTLNGKINYRALPSVEEARARIKRDFVPPQTSTEKTLAAIWSEVLGVERVGVHDNFFELGGHSLLATLIVSRVREVFQVDLPLRSLFKVPTVAGIAEHVETMSWAARGALAQPVAAGQHGEEGEL
jgi:tyrocidine synthetase-3